MKPRTTRRVLGAAILVALVASAVAVWVLRDLRSVERRVAPGVSALRAAVATPDAGQRSSDLATAERIFRDALAGAPLDPYPAFLLTVVDALRIGAELPPQPRLFERALYEIGANRPDRALLLVQERPAPRRTEADRMLMRLLREWRRPPASPPAARRGSR